MRDRPSARSSGRPVDVQCTIAPDLGELEPLRLAVVGPLKAAGVDQAAVFRVELVLEEVLSNVVRHGDATQIALHAQLLAGQVRLLFEDDGPPFDPTAHPAPVDAPDALAARTGGRGIQLALRFAVSVAYAYEDGLNRLTVAVAT